MKNGKTKIYIKSSIINNILKTRSLPYAIKQRIKIELERMIKGGILEPVGVSEWVTSIVPVIKDDGSIRTRSDYKLAVNQVSQLDDYPIPKKDTLFVEISGCYKFTKLDLKYAYQQMILDKSSRELLTINTHLGLFNPALLIY